MNILLEAQPGDEIVCIAAFHASPDGAGFSWSTSRAFRVGERVRYVGARQDAHLRERPNGWFALFETDDGKQYAATQTYFVTEEVWQAIEQHCRDTAKV